MTALGVARPAHAGRSFAEQEIGVFLATVAILTGISTSVALREEVDVRHIEDASALGQGAMYLQAFLPALAALVARLVVHRSLRGHDWGVRRTSWKHVAAGWGFGVGLALAGAIVVWAIGGGFLASALEPSLVLGPTLFVLPYLVLAIGEDVGWRGLLVARLAEVVSPRAVIVLSGLAWSAFHWPLIARLGGTPDGVPTWFALSMFTVGTTALGAVLASMQLRWGLWPGVVAHAAVNATAYHFVEPLTIERGSSLWLGSETGAVTAMVAVVLAVLWLRAMPLARSRTN